MYIARIIFKRDKRSEYEEGYFIGSHKNAKDEATYLDEHFQPVQVYDSVLNGEHPLEISL